MQKINKKGQTSIEILTILGVLIVGAVILGSFYLGNINSKVESVTNLESETSSIGDWLNEDPGVENPNCGNGTIDSGEECDTTNLNGQTCSSLGFASGTLNCADNCMFDTTSCVSGSGSVNCFDGTCNVDAGECSQCSDPGEDCFESLECSAPESFILKTLPEEGGSGVINQNYYDFVLHINLNSSSYVDIDLEVIKFDNIAQDFLPTDKCTFDGIPVPIGGINLGQHTTDIDVPIMCSSVGNYVFIFNGVDEQNNIGNSPIEFEYLVDTGSSEYALCGSTSNSNGSLDICINNLENTTTNSNGSLSLYIDNPDLSEHNAVCTTNSNGSLCISIGQII